MEKSFRLSGRGNRLYHFRLVKSMEKKHDFPLIQEANTINSNMVYM